MKCTRCGGLLALALLVASGCARETVPDRDVSLHLDNAIRSNVDDLDLIIERSPQGALEYVILRGMGARERRMVHWSMHWFDRAGRRIEGTTDRWRRATINPGASFQLEAGAPVDGARRAELHVRPYP